jgi:hypothetical protein
MEAIRASTGAKGIPRQLAMAFRRRRSVLTCLSKLGDNII